MTPKVASAGEVRAGTYRWWVLANVLLVNALVVGAAWNYVIVLVPEFTGGLGGDVADFFYLWSAITAGLWLFALPAGALGDRLGVRGAVGGGLLVGAASLALRAGAESLPLAAGSMLVFGFVLAAVIANGPKALALHFPAANLGLANGIAQAGVGLGLALTTWVVPRIADAAGGWRGLSRALAFAMAAAAALWITTVRGAGTGQIGAVFPPIVAALRARGVRAIAIAYFLYLLGYIGAVGYLPTYFVSARGMDPESAGALMSLGPISFVVGSMALPSLSDAIGMRRQVYLGGMALGGVALFAAGALDGAAVRLAMLGFGFATGVIGLLFVIPAELPSVGPERAGSAVGAATMAGFSGGVLSPIVGGWLVQTSPWLAFAFWGLALLGSALAILAVRETGRRVAASRLG